MRKLVISFVVLFLMAGSVSAGEAPGKIETKNLTGVPNAVQLEENLIAGGAPNAQGLKQAAEQGIRTVIDVRDPKEGTAEESQHAQAAGMKYYNIPVTPDNFSTAQADQLATVLKDPATGPALLHCASGQRATAVWALYRNRHEGVSADQAMKEAGEKGLKKPILQSKLKELLK